MYGTPRVDCTELTCLLVLVTGRVPGMYDGRGMPHPHRGGSCRGRFAGAASLRVGGDWGLEAGGGTGIGRTHSAVLVKIVGV